ncbi:hypothetical protein G6F35_017558 [Rhizopus arrhizus]|nr:hypothetical protein G6F35_017558 [Rhizopus arrhizus]
MRRRLPPTCPPSNPTLSMPRMHSPAAAAGRSWASCRVKSPCCLGIGTGWARNPAAPRWRCASWSSRRAATTRRGTSSACARKPPTDSCPAWPATWPVSRTQPGRSMQTTANALRSALPRGRRTCAPTRWAWPGQRPIKTNRCRARYPAARRSAEEIGSAHV